jgi:hypothetical protein
MLAMLPKDKNQDVAKNVKSRSDVNKLQSSFENYVG